MRLALAAGRLDVDEVLAGLSGRQLLEWQAYESIEGGFGDRAAWQRVAMLAQMYGERNRDRKKRSAAFTVKEFLPYVDRDEAEVPAGARIRAQFQHLVKKG